MKAFKSVFDPLDLAIIERVYEAALAQFEAHRASSDSEKDEELKDALRKRVMACAAMGSSSSTRFMTGLLGNRSKCAK